MPEHSHPDPTLAPPVRETASVSPCRIDGHVLLAEDNAHLRTLVEEYLRRAGARVTGVCNGLEALACVKSALAGASAIDIILMDIHMPEMEGPEAMRRIRSAGYRGPIVALTADLGSDDAQKWYAAGCDQIAAKPIDRVVFLPMLARLLETHRRPA